MPRLCIRSLALPREVKRTLATELTETIVETRHLTGAERDGCVIEFRPFAADDLAIGGRLVSNGRPAEVELSYRDSALGAKEKTKLARRLSETVARVLEMEGPALRRISFVFEQLNDRDHAFGGVLQSELGRSRSAKERPGLVGRLGRLVRRRGARARADGGNLVQAARSSGSPERPADPVATAPPDLEREPAS